MCPHLGTGADEFAGGYSNRLDSPRQSWSQYLQQDVQVELRQQQARILGIPKRFLAVLADGYPGSCSGHTRPLSPYQAKMRDLLPRWLPGYPTDRPKVSFFVTGDMSHINLLAERMLRRIFPEFRDKYLECGDALFSAAKLSHLFQGANAASDRGCHAIWLMLETMAIAVFHGLCQELANGRRIPGVDRPSPLRAADDAALGRLTTSPPAQAGDAVPPTPTPAATAKPPLIQRILGRLMN